MKFINPKYKILLINLILIFASIACVKPADPAKDDKLSLPKTPYTSNQLRVDGYYYYLIGNKIISIKFLNRNGVFSTSGIRNGENFDQVKNYIMNEWGNLKDKYYWGVFVIDGGDIKLEQWHISNDGVLPAYVRAGIILNDTTFYFNKIYRMKDGIKTEVKEINETYYFKTYSPKPDSTNSFIP